MSHMQSIPLQWVRWKVQPFLLFAKCRRYYPTGHTLCRFVLTFGRNGFFLFDFD